MSLYAQPVGLTLAKIRGDQTRMHDLDPGKLETTLEQVGRDNSALVVKIETNERLRVHPAFGGLCAEIADEDVQPHESKALAEVLAHIGRLCQYDAWCVAYLGEPCQKRRWGVPEFPKVLDTAVPTFRG